MKCLAVGWAALWGLWVLCPSPGGMPYLLGMMDRGHFSGGKGRKWTLIGHLCVRHVIYTNLSPRPWLETSYFIDSKSHISSPQFNISEIRMRTRVDAILQSLSARWQSQPGGGKTLHWHLLVRSRKHRRLSSTQDLSYRWGTRAQGGEITRPPAFFTVPHSTNLLVPHTGSWTRSTWVTCRA